MTMFKTSITSADPQGQQAVKLFQAAYSGLKLDEIQAQTLNEHGHLLKEAVEKAIKSISAKSGDLWSDYEYPKQYRKPRPVMDQLEALTKLFPNINVAGACEFTHDIMPTIEAPFGAEGWFAIPRWEKMFGSYQEAVSKVFQELTIKRRWKYHCDDRIARNGGVYPGVYPGIPVEEDQAKFARATRDQKGVEGDVVIIPAQFGRRHRGRSLPRVRKTMRKNEFGLGAFAVGCMLLTHYGRLVPAERPRSLDCTLICPGDEYPEHSDGRVEDSPSFSLWGDGGISIWRHSSGSYGQSNCAVTGFVPQGRSSNA